MIQLLIVAGCMAPPPVPVSPVEAPTVAVESAPPPVVEARQLDAEVPRSDLPRHVMDLVRDLEVSPHRGGCGGIDGYRLRWVRRGSIPYRIGLRRGDVVHWVADRPTTSLARLLNLADRLFTEAPDEVVVGLTRRGEAVEITVEVVDGGRAT